LRPSAGRGFCFFGLAALSCRPSAGRGFYFLFLDEKKVAKKNQEFYSGHPNALAA